MVLLAWCGGFLLSQMKHLQHIQCILMQNTNIGIDHSSAGGRVPLDVSISNCLCDVSFTIFWYSSYCLCFSPTYILIASTGRLQPAYSASMFWLPQWIIESSQHLTHCQSSPLSPTHTSSFLFLASLHSQHTCPL